MGIQHLPDVVPSIFVDGPGTCLAWTSRQAVNAVHTVITSPKCKGLSRSAMRHGLHELHDNFDSSSLMLAALLPRGCGSGIHAGAVISLQSWTSEHRLSWSSCSPCTQHLPLNEHSSTMFLQRLIHHLAPAPKSWSWDCQIADQERVKQEFGVQQDA